MLPTPEELRRQSRLYREAARNAAELATKRLLAECAAWIAEAIEREGQLVQNEKVEHYKLLLDRALGDKTWLVVDAIESRRQAAQAARTQIRAWRMRAEELRATAYQFAVPSAQDSLRRAAANYDKLADHVEALWAGQRSTPSDKAG
jgi:hypothetical protein